MRFRSIQLIFRVDRGHIPEGNLVVQTPHAEKKYKGSYVITLQYTWGGWHRVWPVGMIWYYLIMAKVICPFLCHIKHMVSLL